MKLRTSLLILPLALSWLSGADSRSVREGVYTKEQAARGIKTYRTACARCHGENLLGGDEAPGLTGEDFLQKWTGKTIGDLFDVIRKTMPSDGPGVLSRQESSDITAYILSENEFPAARKELDTDDSRLKEIRIEQKR